jgi:hypothetical protein
MSNNLLTIDMVTRRALMSLHEKLTFVRSVNRQYDNSFAQSGAQIGSALRVRKPAQYLAVSGAVMTPQDSIEQSVTLNVTNQVHVGISFSSAERSLTINDYAAQVLDPAMSVMAAAIEADCIKRATQKTNQLVGTPNTVPNTLTPYLEAREKLNQALAPKDRNRHMLISSRFSTKIVDALKSLSEDSGEIGRQYREGSMGRAVGFDWAESESMWTHANGTGTVVCAVDATVAVDGTTSLALKGLGASGTVTVGSVLSIAARYDVHPETKTTRPTVKQFVVTAVPGAADGTGDLTVTVSPPIYYASTGRKNIASAPTADDVVTIVGAASTSYEQGLAYHKNAFTFATADLELPDGARGSRQVFDGISMRIVKDFDITNDLHPCRVDVLYGFEALRGEHACRITA